MAIQPQNNNLNFLTDPKFTYVIRLFVLSFARNITGDYRDSFSDYYEPNFEIKDFDVLIGGKSFFDLPVKNKEKAYEKTIEMNRNNGYTTGNLLNIPYFKNNERLISNDLSKQINLKDPQQINFIGKIGKVSAITFFIIKK